MRGPFDELVDALTPRPPVRAAWWGWAIAAALAIAVVVALAAITEAYAQGLPGAAVDCKEFRQQIVVAAWARDMGADENKVGIFYHRAYRHRGYNLSRAIEREVRRLWHEKLPGERAVDAAWRRCEQQLGELGAEG